jgi:hypothetical protein
VTAPLPEPVGGDQGKFDAHIAKLRVNILVDQRVYDRLNEATEDAHRETLRSEAALLEFVRQVRGIYPHLVVPADLVET